MKNLLSFVLVATTAAAAPLSDKQGKHAAVHITNGTVIGASSDHVDSFMGIPYANPPVGQLRLRPPQTIDQPFGRLVLPEIAAACFQMNMSSVDTTGLPEKSVAVMDNFSANFTGPSSEDCLTINVQRPAAMMNTDTNGNNSHGKEQKKKKKNKLPVLFWIYGGGWEIGTTQDYDGTAIVEQSIAMGEPVIFVAVNYRVNAFGFLQGKELQQEGSTNLGLRDQRKALEWVAENIEAFGGDPDRVTIWGESAGAVSVMDHMLINGGDHNYQGKPLFHGAIMNSGTVARTLAADSTKAQDIFDKVSEAAGCGGGGGGGGGDDPRSSSSDSGSGILSCLREAPLDTFLTAMNSVPNFMTSHSNDLSYIRRSDPADGGFYSEFSEVAVAKGDFAKVPIIAGNMQDEATVFSFLARGLVDDDDEQLVDYLMPWLPEAGRQLLGDLIATYPDDDGTAGLPAGTGSEYEVFHNFKRLAAIQTDLTFTMGRRQVLSDMVNRPDGRGVPAAWSYLATYQPASTVMPYWGTHHTADLATQFSLKTNEFAGRAMNEAYIRFVRYSDPNGGGNSGHGHQECWWPQWDQENLWMANFSASDVGLTRDDFRWESYEFWKEHSAELRQ